MERAAAIRCSCTGVSALALALLAASCGRYADFTLPALPKAAEPRTEESLGAPITTLPADVVAESKIASSAPSRLAVRPRVKRAPVSEAGASAAERLARAGLKTIVLDEKLAWEKPCGGGLTTRNEPECRHDHAGIYLR